MISKTFFRLLRALPALVLMPSSVSQGGLPGLLSCPCALLLPTCTWTLTVRSLTGRENEEVGPSGVRDSKPDELGHCCELDVLC